MTFLPTGRNIFFSYNFAQSKIARKLLVLGRLISHQKALESVETLALPLHQWNSLENYFFYNQKLLENYYVRKINFWLLIPFQRSSTITAETCANSKFREDLLPEENPPLSVGFSTQKNVAHVASTKKQVVRSSTIFFQLSQIQF